ncbi:aminomethyltransferase family protein [Natronocalculus amylovorans]|uniref:Aminomethyltransferase family protein n=1 Tax=Natronocalculus amylovorans TaxID=2917812 RepID=A0AAE3FUW0_9EURY|nr:aminomethyltransferase family protein [Natronocalculus amylovorans]MCL9815656.1 aminomethyltransferase family protein [Natronocalculus amylovorans]
MTLVADVHSDHGATFTERGDRTVVDHYGRPDRAVRAVRNGVGVIEHGYGIVEITGDDRIEYVDNIISNRVPRSDGQGVYALLLDPNGRIETDMYLYNGGERLLLFTPPETVSELVSEWQSKIFIQDVSIEEISDRLAVFGVHGPQSTEKVASVLNQIGAPEPELTFDRGSMGDVGVTVIASDNPIGEEGYEIICAAEEAAELFDTLLTRGMNAAPFGYRTWDILTLEAGTPLFTSELRDRIPNTIGMRNALDFEKGCFVGQEVVSKVENRGQPSRKLVGLTLDRVVPENSTIVGDGEQLGTVTRSVESPTLETAIGFGFVPYQTTHTEVTVETSAQSESAMLTALPFVRGSAQSLRCPQFETQ